MKILSSFDTKAAINRYLSLVEIHGTENVMLVQKSKLFFYKYIGGKYLLYLILLVLASYFYYTIQIDFAVRIDWVFWWLFGVYLLGVVISTSKQWMNYRMDYLLVTPHEITFHDQRSVFSDDIQSLRSDKIKSITYSKSWIIQSLFNVWTLHFLVEGDGEAWDIHIDYVDAVEHTEKRIMQIITPD